MLHGGLRNNTEYCVLCHNPSNTDASTRATAVVASYKTQPAQGINFNLLVHRIHDGVNAVPAGAKAPYVVVGHGGSINDFSGILFPVMSPSGNATYMQDCSICHTNGSEQVLPTGLNLAARSPGMDSRGIESGAARFVGLQRMPCLETGSGSHFLANTDVRWERAAMFVTPLVRNLR